MKVLSPIPSEGLVDVPDSMAEDPSFALVQSDPTAWQKLRCRHDFEYWCLTCCTIRHKTLGRDVPFVLNKPQKRVAAIFEEDRRAGRPIRVIMLKARQWGGSTLVLAYMAWLQSCICRNWNSIICSQVKDTSSVIRGMYTKLLENYPPHLWEGDEPPRFRAFEGSRNVREIAGRGCRVTVSSIENQDSVRGSDFAMAHLSETAFWRPTPSHTPEDLVRAVCASVALAPNTMVVMESTANGVGNFFHREWQRCCDNGGDKRPVFVPWFEIEAYMLPVDNPEEFAASLTPYELMLRDKGCSLEQINWYRHKLREYPSHSQMMAEFPTTPEEAFSNTGSGIFAAEHVERLRRDCSDPLAVGELSAVVLSDDDLRRCREDLCRRLAPRPFATPRPTAPKPWRSRPYEFRPDSAGNLHVWQFPAPSGDYIAAVDVGGRTARADFSVIAVVRIDLPRPEVVAQWRGHIDHDILARKAMEIGTFYNDALLAVESNTLEQQAAGMFILQQLRRQYPRLYHRSSDRPGFHTNANTKQMLVTGLMAAVRDHAYVERSAIACDEMLCYYQAPDGSYAARPGSHDDVLITRALALHIATQ